jgi:hypothetical protein
VGLGDGSKVAIEMFKQQDCCNKICQKLKLPQLVASTNNSEGATESEDELLKQ